METAQAQSQEEKVKDGIAMVTVHLVCATHWPHVDRLNPHNDATLQKSRVKRKEVECFAGTWMSEESFAGIVRKMLVQVPFLAVRSGLWRRGLAQGKMGVSVLCSAG